MSELTTYELLLPVTGSSYLGLLDWLARHSRFFSLVVRRNLGLSGSAEDLLARLAPFLVDSREASEWPGTRLLGETARVFLYRAEREAMRVLAERSFSQGSWLQPDLPEDLAFLRAPEDPTFFSIVHEGYSALRLTPAEVLELRRELPDVARLLERPEP